VPIKKIVVDQNKCSGCRQCEVAILPEDIYLSDTRPPGPDVNKVRGRLTEINDSSSIVCCTIKTGKNSLKVKLP